MPPRELVLVGILLHFPGHVTDPLLAIIVNPPCSLLLLIGHQVASPPETDPDTSLDLIDTLLGKDTSIADDLSAFAIKTEPQTGSRHVTRKVSKAPIGFWVAIGILVLFCLILIIFIIIRSDS